MIWYPIVVDSIAMGDILPLLLVSNDFYFLILNYRIQDFVAIILLQKQLDFQKS